MLALILDSLGSTELVFILVIALIFFGPRKLPQMARQMGKSLAEFRKASDDFKRTWEREVAIESSRTDVAENSILNDETQTSVESGERQLTPEPVDPDSVVARPNPYQPTTVSVAEESAGDNSQPEPMRKHDWV